MTIRMIGFVEQKPVGGVQSNTFKKMTQQTERVLGLKSEKLSRDDLKQLVKEECVKVHEELEKAAKKITKDLEEIRKEYAGEMMMRVRENGASFQPALEKRIHINTVAELIDVPVNELMLYFLNSVKHTNERKLIEYRQGHVTFYAN